MKTCTTLTRHACLRLALVATNNSSSPLGIFAARSSRFCVFAKHRCGPHRLKISRRGDFLNVCAPRRDRTSDILLKRELLYQLSYGRIHSIYHDCLYFESFIKSAKLNRWPGRQVVRQLSAKELYVGAIPTQASLKHVRIF